MLAIKSLMLCLMLSIPAIAVPLASVNAKYADILGLTVLSDRSAYYYGEPINLLGNFTQYGQPVSNGTVGISIYDPSGAPVAFRTAKTGPGTPPSSLLDFLELTPCDGTGAARSSFLTQQIVWVRITIINYDALEHYEITPITIFDANGVPLVTRVDLFGTLGPGASSAIFFMATTIPSWAQPGNATLSASIFSGYPKDGGTPYCEEKNVNFEIKRNPNIGYSTPAAANPQTPNGTFASSFKLSPISKPGNYRVDASARSTLVNATHQSLLTTQYTTFFSLLATQTPPQAAFTYYPIDAYVTLAITFDASASTAEGYNVTIVNYLWDFGDGSAKVSTSSPVTTHTFTLNNIYTVALNVTDSQGLTCATFKFITVLSPDGPQAAFTYNPIDSCVNMNITFDASSSRTNNTIVNYLWDFGDGSAKVSTSNPVTTHTFTLVNIYTVALKVTDSQGYWCPTSTVITILSSTYLKAAFTWHPATPKPNSTATFDATATKLGWNGTAYLLIVNYAWDFGDGNVTTGYYPTIVHTYDLPGNYAVTLNVTDASGFTDDVTQFVRVQQSTLIGDINGDGVVNILDAIRLGNAFLSRPGYLNWNSNADLNGDGVVNILDAIMLGNHFGEHL